MIHKHYTCSFIPHLQKTPDDDDVDDNDDETDRYTQRDIMTERKTLGLHILPARKQTKS